MAKFIGEITHTEKFTTKEGEEKTKYTKVGALFKDEEKGYYSVNFLGQWLAVFEKKDGETKKAPKEEVSIDSIPF